MIHFFHDVNECYGKNTFQLMLSRSAVFFKYLLALMHVVLTILNVCAKDLITFVMMSIVLISMKN
jgi:hypothetical protein